MIAKLRKRIIAINGITACLILFLAVVITFAWGLNRTNAERDGMLQIALTYDPTDTIPPEQKETLENIAVFWYDSSKEEGSRVGTLFFDKNCDMNEEDLQKKVENIATSKDDDGYIGLIRYMKCVDEETGVVKVAFTNLNSKFNGIMKYTGMVLIALVVGLVGNFVISWLLARMALAPVEESWKKQKQFVADASHELKTPLSVIMANTDIIMSHKDETVESQMKWLENTRTESQRMAGLVADLLFLAKNDDGLQIQMEEVNLSQCVGSIVLGYDAVFYENNKSFSYDIVPDIKLNGNLKQLQQLATILLDNANKYSTDSGNIKLTLSSNSKHAVLVVQNQSEQLSEEQLSHLFDRFYTVDPSRNKNNGGNGLGLSIAKMICETHGGSIRVECIEGVTAFTVTLPIKKK